MAEIHITKLQSIYTPLIIPIFMTNKSVMTFIYINKTSVCLPTCLSVSVIKVLINGTFLFVSFLSNVVKWLYPHQIDYLSFDTPLLLLTVITAVIQLLFKSGGRIRDLSRV